MAANFTVIIEHGGLGWTENNIATAEDGFRRNVVKALRKGYAELRDYGTCFSIDYFFLPWSVAQLINLYLIRSVLFLCAYLRCRINTQLDP